MKDFGTGCVLTFRRRRQPVIPHPPETRPSLILRLRDNCDAEAWQEFTAIYQPLVYRLARMKGLQDADAQELVQDVMVAVSGAVENWVPDADRGRFRHWLFRIARNLLVNYLTRRRFRPLGTGDSRIAAMLEQQCDRSSEESTVFDIEFRREVFRWAAEQVRGQVTEKTWNAFWRSTVDDRPVSAVARDLEMTVGSVYIARSRVMARLRETVQRFNGESHDG